MIDIRKYIKGISLRDLIEAKVSQMKEDDCGNQIYLLIDVNVIIAYTEDIDVAIEFENKRSTNSYKTIPEYK